MDIKEFLLARIAEDEVAARAAFDEPFLSSVDDGVWCANSSSRSPSVTGTSYFSIEGGEPDCMTEGQAVHIARHDPARVLAECVAKRAIIRRYIHSPTPNAYDLALLDVMRALAVVYSDHPDYRPEWVA